MEGFLITVMVVSGVASLIPGYFLHRSSVDETRKWPSVTGIVVLLVVLIGATISYVIVAEAHAVQTAQVETKRVVLARDIGDVLIAASYEAADGKDLHDRGHYEFTDNDTAAHLLVKLNGNRSGKLYVQQYVDGWRPVCDHSYIDPVRDPATFKVSKGC